MEESERASSDVLERFLRYVAMRNTASVHTQDAYRRDIEGFLSFLKKEGIDSLEDVDRIVMMNYVASLSVDEHGRPSRGISPPCAHSIAISMNTWACRPARWRR